MNLWILRHARAEAHSASGRDRDRHLSAAGQRACLHLRQWLEDHRIERPSRILVSPALRTRQTAEQVFGPDDSGSQESAEWLWQGDFAPLESIVSSDGGAQRVIALVGHNPGLENLARWLGGELPPAGLKPGALVILALPQGLAAKTAHTVFQVPPREST